MKILHLDKNHPLLIEQLQEAGFANDVDYLSSKEAVQQKIHQFDGIIIRSRFKLDEAFLSVAKNLKFIGRLGAGLENIDVDFAASKNIQLFSAPEGNRNAVGEHTLALLLNLFNKINKADQEVRKGKWLREENRGVELDGKTVGIIGYGNMGKAFAKKLKGFEVKTICYDILPNVGDENASQVSWQQFIQQAEVVSLHTPLTANTQNLVDAHFISDFQQPFWFINTGRGQSVVTKDLVEALKSKKVLGAGLDVLEYEKTSFENLFTAEENMPEAFQYLIEAENVILSPHVAGWTVESKAKLAQVIVDKIKTNFKAEENAN